MTITAASSVLAAAVAVALPTTRAANLTSGQASSSSSNIELKDFWLKSASEQAAIRAKLDNPHLALPDEPSIEAHAMIFRVSGEWFIEYFDQTLVSKGIDPHKFKSEDAATRFLLNLTEDDDIDDGEGLYAYLGTNELYQHHYILGTTGVATDG